MAVKFTFSVESARLADDFKRACKHRGHKYSYVLTSAMRYFVEHPHSRGWGNGGDEKQAMKKSKVKKSLPAG